MFKGDVGGVKSPPQTSKPQNTAVGSGNRPMDGSVMIPTSAPSDPHKLERYSGSHWLK